LKEVVLPDGTNNFSHRLDIIDYQRCGGIEVYLKGIGVTAEQMKAVKRNLLE